MASAPSPDAFSAPARASQPVGPIPLLMGLVVAAAGAFGLFVTWLILTSDHVTWAPLASVTVLLCGWGFVGGGLLLYRRRGAVVVGTLMVAEGFAWMAYWLKAAQWPGLSSIGLLVGQGLAVVLFVHLLMVYPDGRVRGRLARIVLAALYTVFILGNVILALIGTAANEGCTECPGNAFAVAHPITLANTLENLQGLLGLPLVAGVLLVCVRKYRAASPPARRELRPLIWPGVMVLVVIGGVLLLWAFTPNEASSPEVSLARLAMGMAAVSFLAGLWWEGVHRRHVVSTAMTRLSLAPPPGALEGLMREALEDPTVELGYWQQETGRYVDLSGRAFALPEPGAGRGCTVVERDGRPVAAIVHDSALDGHADAVLMIANAAVLSLENERLQAELRSTINRLSESEARFRELLEETPLLATIVDTDEVIHFANRALGRLAGCPSGDLVGKPWSEVFGDFPEEREVWDMFVNSGQVTSGYESRVHDQDGAEHVIAWTNAPITGPDGTARQIASLGEDVTARRAAEELAARAQRERLELLNELLTAEEAERARIAEALHDDTIQALTASLYTLDRLAVSEQPGARIAETRGMLAEATDRARRLMFELRPPLLEETGLAAAITDLCDQLADDGGFRASVDAPPRRYPRVIEDICYRTVREAALNTRRHAHASQLRVRIDEQDGALVGLVEDDGVGFDTSAPIDRLHLGIYAMSQRVTLADGAVEIDSRPGAGTRVSFRIPTA